MNKVSPKSKPLGFVFTVTFIAMILVLVFGVFMISQLTFTRNTNNIIKIQTEAINEQIIYNFEVYTEDIIRISNQVQALVSNIDINDDQEVTKNLFESINYLDSKYKDIEIYSTLGTLIVSNSKDSEEVVSEQDWFIGAINDKTVHYFSAPKLINDRYLITISKYLSFNKYQDYGVLRMNLDFSTLISLADKSNLGVNGHISILNNNYDYIYTSKKVDSFTETEEKELFKEIIIGKKEVVIEDQAIYFMVNMIGNTPWKIGVFININEIMLIRHYFIVSMMIFSLIFIVISSIIYYSVSKSISKPLNKLKDAMSNVDQIDKLDLTKVEINHPREVEILSNSFNVMIDRIKGLMDSIIKEKEQQRKSELKALQNQINPHFLYNTLDSIVYMVENNENESAAEMIIALSRLFKISISGGRNIISVEDEINHARSYLFIQKIRYKDKFTYEINIDNEDILKLDTMKLILQPLIENALYHGINKINDNGLIIINVGSIDDLIKFEVIDNGYGMTDEKINELYAVLDNDDLSDGVGLKNIYQRLKVYYGTKASLEITSEADEGTKIQILIPAGEVL
ncbi:sensor histidine kinase [Haploplasma axanthum]|nr:sensor histidine kinase [Haploplasma axanthum]